MSHRRKTSESGEFADDQGQPDAALPETPLAVCQALAAAQSDKVSVREEGGLLIYSAGDVDLLSREPGSNVYTLLVDCPPTGARAGERKVLCEPCDEQCACTARDLANHLA